MILSSAAVPPSFLKLAGMMGGASGFLRGMEPRADAPEASDASQRERGLAFLLRRVQEQLGAPPRPPAAFRAAEPLPTARETADSILGFVRSRLQHEAAQGADPERLEGLLNAAREGFERGYREALADLQALGALDDALGAALEETRDRVRSGLDALSPDSLAAPEPAVPPLAFERYQREVSSVETASLALEVRTQDGDRVRIRLESLDAFRSEESFTQQRGPGGTATRAEVSTIRLTSERFAIRVEGELDEAEQAALRDLLGRVDSLADQFFEGNAQLALEQALSLGYDRDEIAGFSLRITATDVRQVSETYRRVSALVDGTERPSGRGASDLAQSLRPLGQFLQAIRDAETAAESLGRPGQLLRQMLEGTLSLLDSGEALLAADRALLDLLGDGEEDDSSEHRAGSAPALSAAA